MRMDLRTALKLSNAQALVEAVSKDMNGDLPQDRITRLCAPCWEHGFCLNPDNCMASSRAYDFMDEKWIDPRDPDPTKEGIFRDHRCWRCDDGQRHCPFKGRERDCENLRARND